MQPWLRRQPGRRRAGGQVRSEVIIELERAGTRPSIKDVKFIASILADESISTFEDGSRADKQKNWR